MLAELARRLGVADRLSFPGVMPFREAMALGRILVVPSRAELLPYVVLEAAAARVPMIATDVGGIPEIFGPFSDRLGPCGDAADLARRMAGDARSGPVAARRRGGRPQPLRGRDLHDRGYGGRRAVRATATRSRVREFASRRDSDVQPRPEG